MDRQAQRALICQGCGHFIDESHDDDIKSAWIAEKQTCWGCAAKERDERASNEDGKRQAPGTKRTVRNRAKG